MKITIVQRLWALVALAVLAVAFVGFAGIRTAYGVKGDLDSIRNDLFPSVYTLNQMTRAIINIRLAVLTHVTAETPKERADQDKRFGELRTELMDLTDKYEKQFLTGEADRKLLEADRELFREYTAQAEKVMAASNAGDQDAARVELKKLREVAIRVNKNGVTPHIKANDAEVDRVNHEAETVINKGLSTNLLVSAISILAVVGLGVWLVRAVTRGLHTVESTVADIERRMDLMTI